MPALERSRLFEIYLAVRVIVATLVLGSIAVAQLVAQDVLNINPLNGVIIFMLAYTLFSAFLYLSLGYRPALLHAQFLGDLVSISALVYLTGTYGSPLTVLYILFIAVCAFILPRNALIRLASVAGILYGLMVLAVVFRVVPPYPSEWFPAASGEYRPALSSLLVNLAAFMLTAYLVSIPLESMRKARQAMEVQRLKLTHLENLIQFIVARMPNPFFLTDADGTVRYANAIGRELLGDTAAVASGTVNLFRLLAIPIRPEDLRRKSTWNFIVRVRTDQVFEVRAYTMKVTEEETVWMWIFQDITEELQRQEQAQVREKMIALGQMAAGLAHEIKNPLAAIHASVQLLQRDGSGSEAHGEILAILEKETRRLRDVVDRFLRFARADTLSPEWIQVAPLVQEVVKLVRKIPEWNDAHSVEVQIMPPDLALQADPVLLKQVFWNLLVNAIKAMPEGGRIAITASLDGRWAAFSVADTGPGIPRERLKNIFQPFQPSTTGGLGLGLAIVYNIVEAHGGTIRVRSQKGSGTCFEFTLPVEVS